MCAVIMLDSTNFFENSLFVEQCVCFDLVIAYELMKVALRPSMIPHHCYDNVEELKLEHVTLLSIIHQCTFYIIVMVCITIYS